MNAFTHSAGDADSPHGCRLCGGSRLECMGDLADTDFFAGRVIAQGLSGGQLWRCLDCESLFRHPVLSPDAYRRLYESGAAGQWSGDAERLDLRTVRSVLMERSGGRVLDIGCGNGDFLASLPTGFERCGIEPSLDAAGAAQQRGIRILAAGIEELPVDARFDVITLIDVIEHVAEPQGLLDRARAHLVDGGVIIVSTGDPSNGAWRKVFGSRFWYSSFPEHISFPSRRFFAAWAGGTRASLVDQRATRYRALPAWKVVAYLFIQLVYLASPRALDFVGRTLGTLSGAPQPRRRHFSPGVAGLFVDHQVVVVRSRSAQDDAQGATAPPAASGRRHAEPRSS